LPWDAMSISNRTGVSFVIPVKNDAKHLRAAAESIETQSHLTNFEIVLAVAPSSDETEEIASRLASSSSKIKIVPNAMSDTASGLNAAISKSRFELVIRVDAHSKLSKGYAVLAQKILSETGAANVGGRMVAAGNTAFQKAVAHAYNNRIGLGGGAFHVGGKAGPVDSVYLGCFQKSWLDKVGGFNPKWVRGQDWELNKRIREAGGLVWFDPRLEVTYYPRDNWKALAKQFFNTGIWRGALTREAPTQAALRYWIPPLLVLSTIFWLPLWLYLIAVGFMAVGATELSWRSRLWLMVVLPTMHFSWGIGFWIGLVRGAK
jgi:succinoglycan biosynthesis protein ExoA